MALKKFDVSSPNHSKHTTNSKNVPAIRSVFRRIDRALLRVGIMGGVTSFILFSQMFLGLMGSECGPHLCVLSVLLFRFLFVWHPVVSVAIWALNFLFLAVYFVSALVCWMQVKNVVPNPKPLRLSWSVWLTEVMHLGLSIVGVAIRSWYPGVRCKRGIVFCERDGIKLELDVFFPARSSSGNLPVLLYFHGGSWISGDRFNVPSLLPFFVSQGGVAVSASYRLAPKNPFPAHIQDCNAALAWVMQNISSFGGDANWIVVSGGSAGAHLASLVVSSSLDRHHPVNDRQSSIRGLLSFYGVFDWASKGESDDDIRFRRFLSSVVTRVPVEQDPDQFKHASPCFWFSENRSQIDFPVLLVHGKNDSIAGVDLAERFEKQLKSWGISNVQLVDLWLGHHAFDFFTSLRSMVLNYKLVQWIHASKKRKT